MRVLIADDDVISRTLLQRTLTQLGHDVVAVEDGPSAIVQLLAPDGPRLAILDWMMPGADGLTVCRAVRQRNSPYVYAILLTARDARQDMVEALEAGADDFLTKPLDLTELTARMRAGVRVVELQERLLEIQEGLRVQATRDDLTGLHNRRVVLEHLERELRRGRHEQRPVAVALADIDNFKAINDRYGHPAGDVVLKRVAEALRREVREYDAVGRYGGEEFLFVLPGCDRESGLIAAERIRARVAATAAVWEGVELPVTVSVGLAWAGPGAGTVADLIATADSALYRAKAGGRNRIET